MSSNTQKVWLLGIPYDSINNKDFISDFRSIIWFSYRKNFQKMYPYEITTDRGWGCMLRCAQMVMAQCFQRHFLGRDYRVDQEKFDQSISPYHSRILRWFLDNPSEQCLYSIHHIVHLGIRHEKWPGEWYGPGTAALVLRDLVSVHHSCFRLNLQLLVTNSEIIYIDEVHQLVTYKRFKSSNNEPRDPNYDDNNDDDDNDDDHDHDQNRNYDSSVQEDEIKNTRVSFSERFFHDPLLRPPNLQNNGEENYEWKSSLMIIIPVRLGKDNLSEVYFAGLLKTLQWPQSLGIIGGRPNHAMYFVGFEEHNLLALDPHSVQITPPLDDSFPTIDYLKSVHREAPTKIHINNLDPSLAFAFYFKDRNDFIDFSRRVEQVTR